MEKVDLLSFGSFTYDLIENPYGEKRFCVGGSGAYFSISSSFFDIKVFPVGYISNRVPERVLEKIKEKIDTFFLVQKENLSFHIKYDKKWNAKYLKDLKENVENFDFKNIPEAKFIHVCVISGIEHQLDILKFYKKNRSYISSGTYLNRVKKDREKVLRIIDLSDFFFMNTSEALVLSGKDKWEDVVNFFSSLDKCVIITKGKDGAMFVSKNNIFEVPSIRVSVKDTTGAGESFAGGFIGSYIKYKDPLLSLKFGVTLSSFDIEDFGINRLINIKPEDILKRFKENFHD
ncbi:MAG: PfkB family carbohydrate kinase [Caldiserica bacterium]|nr:PfkB family carbohydrate kinase [Caldisericota bacterium]